MSRTPYPDTSKPDLSLIKEKAEPDSQNASHNLSNPSQKIKIKTSKGPRFQLRNNPTNSNRKEFQSKLEKALKDLNDCKDKFWKEKETPVKSTNPGFAGVYSPSNRLNSAPYQFNSMFSNSFYTNPPQYSTIYNNDKSNSGSKGKKINEMNFTIDVNGVPHSVYTSAADTAGKSTDLINRRYCTPKFTD